MNKTFTFAIIKVLDLFSTELNFGLFGRNIGVEANPIMKYLFNQNNYLPALLIVFAVLVIGFIEKRYKKSKGVQIALNVVILLSAVIVVSNFITYFYSKYLFSQYL